MSFVDVILKCISHKAYAYGIPFLAIKYQLELWCTLVEYGSIMFDNCVSIGWFPCRAWPGEPRAARGSTEAWDKRPQPSRLIEIAHWYCSFDDDSCRSSGCWLRFFFAVSIVTESQLNSGSIYRYEHIHLILTEWSYFEPFGSNWGIRAGFQKRCMCVAAVRGFVSLNCRHHWLN